MARTKPWPAVDDFWTLTPAAHQPGDFRLRWLCTVCHFLLRRAANLPNATDFRPPRGLPLLGMAGCNRRRNRYLAAGLHHHQGIRGTGMASGYSAGYRL